MLYIFSFNLLIRFFTLRLRNALQRYALYALTTKYAKIPSFDVWWPPLAAQHTWVVWPSHYWTAMTSDPLSLAALSRTFIIATPSSDGSEVPAPCPLTTDSSTADAPSCYKSARLTYGLRCVLIASAFISVFCSNSRLCLNCFLHQSFNGIPTKAGMRLAYTKAEQVFRRKYNIKCGLRRCCRVNELGN